MKSLIVKIVLGLGLFAGSLVGGLAATGRLNHEGTANIPVLGSFFPAPAEPAGEAGHEADGAHPAPVGDAVDAGHDGGPGQPLDASHQGEQEPHGAPTGSVRTKIGKSVVNPEVKPADDGHGGGHAEADPNAADVHKDEQKTSAPSAAATHAAHTGGVDGAQAATNDMQRLEAELAADRKNKYAPGGYFRFDGMPAGITPEQLNEAWQRVQGVMSDIDRRKTALDLREQELQELADDISRRQHELGRERTKIEERHRELDARIVKFQEQVKLVRNDEVAALKRNAETLASFERSKAAELLLDQWKTDRGQDEVLRLLEFMDKDAASEILEALPVPMVQDLLKKRLRVSKEAVPPAPGR